MDWTSVLHIAGTITGTLILATLSTAGGLTLYELTKKRES